MVATCRLIQEIVAEHYGLALADLASNSHSPELRKPRRIAIWLCRHLTGLKLEEIGAAFGGWSNYAVHSGIQRVEQLRSECPETGAAVNELLAAIRLSLAMLSHLGVAGPQDINPIDVARRVTAHGSAATRISVLEIRALAAAVITASQAGHVEVCGVDDPPLLAAAKAVLEARRQLDQDLYTRFEAAARNRLQESLAELAEAVEHAATLPQTGAVTEAGAATEDRPNPLIRARGDAAPRRSVF